VKDTEPSATSLRVAMQRAAHQLYDDPKILDDPVAMRLLDAEEIRQLRRTRLRILHPLTGALRAFVVARSRFAEDQLAIARENGTHQYVILGAGLDTFAYRQPVGTGSLSIYEVDHPATQAGKLRRLSAAGITVPDTVQFLPVDLERDPLLEALARAGFDARAPAFVACLGVTMYLTPATLDTTLDTLSALAPGSAAVFDYALPRESVPPFERVVIDQLRRKVARVGEPFQTAFTPEQIDRRLRARGFRTTLDLGREQINARYFRGRSDGLRILGNSVHLLYAKR
jgi:methyltransferase (TIGR00027 family)